MGTTAQSLDGPRGSSARLVAARLGRGSQRRRVLRVWVWPLVPLWRLRPRAGLSPAACDLPPCSLSCPPGEHCEVNVRSGRCASGVCKNGGTCVNLLIGGFHCVCPPGEFERPYCEVTTRSFPPQSFVTFRGLRQRFHFTVALA